MEGVDFDDVVDEHGFWTKLDHILRLPYETHVLIDDLLRSFLALTTTFRQEYVNTEHDVAQCCYKLLDSAVFHSNRTYIRRQILFCFLQDDDVNIIHICTAILLFDGRTDESLLELMQAEGAFPHVVGLIRDGRNNDIGFHRLLIELLFEISRIQKVSREDLKVVDDNFILYLLRLIEELSEDVDDPYHYPVIRVLLALNEQYMCLASDTGAPDSFPVTNRILKLLSSHGHLYRTFGENLILLLNREIALSPQLMILKLLYLLFTTPQTYEYFYTNDLHVLVDVIIRNLLDLDPTGNDDSIAADGTGRDGAKALRHTYLRVLCPLLKNTQLARQETNYKRREVRRLLHLLVNRSSAHFAPVDETILRLVLRCKQIDWIREEGDEQENEIEQRLAEATPRSEVPPNQNFLGMSLDQAGVSSLSVVDVSHKVTKERPALPAPRRTRNKKTTSVESAMHDLAKEQDESPLTQQNLVVTPADESRLRIHSPFADDMAIA